MTMAPVSAIRDVSSELVVVSRAEAERALLGFPSENPFTARRPADDPTELLFIQPEEPRDLLNETIRRTAPPPPRRARRWLVGAMILLGIGLTAGVAASLDFLTRRAPDTVEIAAAAAPSAPPATPSEPTRPVSRPLPGASSPPPVPVAQQSVRKDAAADSRAVRPAVTPPPPKPTFVPQPPPTEPLPTEPVRPSLELGIANSATLPDAKTIALGATPAPPKPSSPPPPAETGSAPIERATTPPVAKPDVSPAPPRDGSADERAVRAVVDRYARAFSNLDVRATGAVWPTVDAKALARSFDRLDQQQIQFSSCQITVTGILADASCAGQTSYVPKIGRKSEHVESHQWNFTLHKADSGWVITAVRSK